MDRLHFLRFHMLAQGLLRASLTASIEAGISGLEYVGNTVSRTCFRCGARFLAAASDRLCPVCRRPKTTANRFARGLSFREKQIIQLVCQARLNKEIASELCLSEGTVKEYLNRLFRKLGTRNRTELALWALANPDAMEFGARHPEYSCSVD